MAISGFDISAESYIATALAMLEESGIELPEDKVFGKKASEEKIRVALLKEILEKEVLEWYGGDSMVRFARKFEDAEGEFTELELRAWRGNTDVVVTPEECIFLYERAILEKPVLECRGRHTKKMLEDKLGVKL